MATLKPAMRAPLRHRARLVPTPETKEDNEASKLEGQLADIAVEVNVSGELQYREGCVRSHEWRIKRKAQLEDSREKELSAYSVKPRRFDKQTISEATLMQLKLLSLSRRTTYLRTNWNTGAPGHSPRRIESTLSRAVRF